MLKFQWLDTTKVYFLLELWCMLSISRQLSPKQRPLDPGCSHLPSAICHPLSLRRGQKSLESVLLVAAWCSLIRTCTVSLSHLWQSHVMGSPQHFLSLSIWEMCVARFLCSLIGPTGWILDNGMWAEVRILLCAWDSTPGLSVFGQLYLEFHIFKMSFVLLTKLSESFFTPLFHTHRIPRHSLSRLFPKYVQHLTTCHHLDPGPDTTTSAWISAVASPALGPLHSNSTQRPEWTR